jgi:phage terminase large subunit-like protein
LTASANAALSGAHPVVEVVPPAVTSAAPELLDLLNLLGMPMLPWQARYLTQMLGETTAGVWAAPECCLVVPRQNGKSHLLAARILAGLFLVGEELITYTAHRVDTALEIFNYVDRLARSHPDTKKQIRRTTRTGGKETLELMDGRRLKILARSRATGRGFTGDCLILDEALELRDHAPINALLPTLATRDNAQLIYASSAGDAGSVVLASVRERGRRGDDPGLCYVEYAADPHGDPATSASGLLLTLACRR